MRLLTVIASLLFAASVAANEDAQPKINTNIHSLQQLLEQVKQDGLRESVKHQEREQLFLKDARLQKQELKKTEQKLRKTKTESEQLKKQFDRNEESLGNLEEELTKRMGNLGEMFGVVRQVSQDVAAIREHSLLANEIGGQSAILNELAESKALPSISKLESLWYEMQLQMTKQGETKSYETTYLDSTGIKQTSNIYHVGPFVAFNETGYLSYDPETRLFIELSKQPSEAGLIQGFIESEGMDSMVIDPTRGTLLNLNSQSPSIMDRIHQGGLIGYVILVLASLGILYSIYLLADRLKTQSKINIQLTNPNGIEKNNPLGRVLSVYQGEKSEHDLETLEMKLDEAVLKELPQLEKGLSLIKLIAAVAPLLGLLGTVTGMIATFQSITLFGTGDPKLMAGGISQALITTVLGLVAAIPLLFMHNILNSRSKNMIQILDQQSAGIIAEHAQKNG